MCVKVESIPVKDTSRAYVLLHRSFMVVSLRYILKIVLVNLVLD